VHDLIADRVLLQAIRLRVLRAQATRLMSALDAAGLHEAAAEVSRGIEAMDRAALLKRGPDVERLH